MAPVGDGVFSSSSDSSGAPLMRVDLGEVPYETAQADMATWVEERRQGLAPNRLFLLTHPAVITYTARTEVDQLPDPTDSDIALVQTDRGGHATYHGPGQLIGYLVLDVRELGPRGLIRRVEESLIDALESLGFPAIRREAERGSLSLAGVWTPDHRKIASIGMRINGGRISSHGFSLNVDSDLNVYTAFTACALPGVQMTSLAQVAAEQGRTTPTHSEVRDAAARALALHLGNAAPARATASSEQARPARNSTGPVALRPAEPEPSGRHGASTGNHTGATTAFG